MADNFVDILFVHNSSSKREDHPKIIDIFSSMSSSSSVDDSCDNLGSKNIAHLQAKDDMWTQKSWSPVLPINLDLESTVTQQTNDTQLLTSFDQKQPALKKPKTKPLKTM